MVNLGNSAGSLSPVRERSTETIPILTRAEFEDSTVIDNEKLRRQAVYVSVASVIFNLVLAAVAFACSALLQSSTTFAFGLDCLMDSLSSIVVAWRYHGSSGAVYHARRERRACLALGICFVLSGVMVIGKSTYDYMVTTSASWHTDLVILAGIGAALCAILFALKYLLYRKIHSQSLFMDAVNSVIGGGFAIVIIITNWVVIYDETLEWIDPLLSIVLALCLMGYGAKVIWDYVQKKKRLSAYEPIIGF